MLGVKKEFEIRHYGMARGGCNSHAKLFIHIIRPDQKETWDASEELAVFEAWDEEFNLKGYVWTGWCYHINTRREFALVPAIIRKALRVGYDVGVSAYNVGPEGVALLSRDPEVVWKWVALSQMWYGQD